MLSLGRDFWFILKILRIIIEVMSALAKEENGDTDTGHE